MRSLMRGNRASTSSMRPFSSPRGSVMPPSSRLWRTDSEPKRFLPWGTKAIPSASNSRCDLPLTRLPSKRTSPERGTSMPNSVLSTVDLPAPFGPISRVISALCASRLSSFNIVRLGEYPATILSNSMIFWAAKMNLALVAKIRFEDLPVRLDFCGRALGEHLAFDHANHMRAELHDEVHVVLNDDKAAALRLVELDQKLAKLVDEARIYAGAGLVEQHQAGRRHESHRDVDELLLAV